jgi:endonuclease III related protein
MPTNLESLYEALLAHFGPQHWWPGETPWEIAVGAILTQQVAWTNVEKAIANLKSAELLELDKMVVSNEEVIKVMIRPVGFYNQKTIRLLDFARYVARKYGSIEKMLDRPTSQVRLELLNVKGIGPETADSILLYAGNHASFVIDAYTKRLARCLQMPEAEDYDKLKNVFESNLQSNVQLYNEYHALIVRLGKENCKTKPMCQTCPVLPFKRK